MTLNLRELSKDEHTRAEKTPFIKRMLKKQISDYEYYVYLFNQYIMYSALEARADELGLLKGIESSARLDGIMKDLRELEALGGFTAPQPLVSSVKYWNYITNDITMDEDKLMAHLYVRHLGDMAGGQILKRMTPGSGRYYSFPGEDITVLKSQLKERLNNDMIDEVKKCFEMVIACMIELGEFLE